MFRAPSYLLPVALGLVTLSCGGSDPEPRQSGQPGYGPRYRYLGVGYAQNPNARFTHYWTQNFGG